MSDDLLGEPTPIEAALAFVRGVLADLDADSAAGRLPQAEYLRRFDEFDRVEQLLRPTARSVAGHPMLTGARIRRLAPCPTCEAEIGKRCCDRVKNHPSRQRAAQRIWHDQHPTAEPTEEPTMSIRENMRAALQDDAMSEQSTRIAARIAAAEASKPVAITVKPAHVIYPGMEPLFHTACTEHPRFGTCQELDAAAATARGHAATAHEKPTSLHMPDGGSTVEENEA